MQRKEHHTGNRREKTVEIDLHTVLSVSLLVIMGVLLFFVLFHFIKAFIPISRFEVKGDAEYTASELAGAADIKRGDKLFRLDLKEEKNEIISKCPYVESIDIDRSLFGKMTFVVKCYEPVWYLEISGDYYVLDRELRVLEETQDVDRLYNSDLIYLTMPHLKSVIVGQTVEFGDSDGEVKETMAIMDTVLNSPTFDMICTADIDNRYDIHFEFDRIVLQGKDEYKELDDVFAVNVGSYTRLEAKLEYIVMALESEDLEGAVGGTIDITEEGNKVSIRTKYTQ